jgi:hypothetical protein
MHTGRFVFAELIAHLPHKEFQKCVTRYDGDHHRRSFSCWDQYLAMAFAQFTYRESLRDIEACLGAVKSKWYHLGFHGKVSRSTLADASEAHDWRIFADFAHYLIGVARSLHAEDPIGFELDHDLYALDSTTIDLCLSLFSWAKFRKHKAAVKMHTLLDLRGNIPVFIRITPARVHDVNILDELTPEPGAFYVVDRGYLDYERLYRRTLARRSGSAVCTYLLVAIVRKRLDVKANLYTILQVLSVTILEKTPILQVLSGTESPIVEMQDHNQLLLFDL